MYPKLLELGPLTLHTYGLMLATAFLVATALLAYLAEQDGIPRNRSWDLGFIVILSALAGAKLLMVLTNWSYYFGEPSRFLTLEFWQAGGAYYGGLIGATLGSFFYIRRDPQIRFLTIADAAAPSIALGQFFGRMGCFAAGCDYGRPTDVAWAVTFTSEYAHRNVGVPLNQPLHPAQLYEAGGTLLLFLLLFWLHGRRRFQGQVICLYFAGYAAIRFANEFFRGDGDRGFVIDGVLSLHQAISLALVIGATVVYWKNRQGKSMDRAR